jgi:pimeloyl-ACP methyl ester carboxylesterase
MSTTQGARCSWEVKKIQERIEDAKMVIIEDAGHASFYEKKDEFATAVLGFVALHGA